MSNYDKALKALAIQDLIFIIFIAVAILNLLGDSYEKKYVTNNDYREHQKANAIFEFTIIISIIIYFYFLIRNYNALKQAPPAKKELYQINLLGSILFIVGGFCILYFQKNQISFVGVPEV